MDENKPPALTQEEVSEAIEHRDAILDVRAIIKTGPGRRFFKYMVKNYDPLFLPMMGLEGAILHEGLGQRRAYIELFNLMSEADPETSAQLLAENIKDRYAKQNIDEQSR
jgi:hypothetical protein